MKKKYKITAAVLAVVICTLLGCERKEQEAAELLLPVRSEEEGCAPDGEDVPADGQKTEVLENADADTGVCVVHVCGAVKKPGVYIMNVDSRIYQAVEKAGGFAQDADENYLNQADLLTDGMKIYVPTEEETAEAGEEIEWKISGSPDAEATDKREQDSLLININTAGEAELTTLPGVGSNKAKSIIAYREKNGVYRKIEDIMNVEGIKDGVFQKIKDSITV